MPAPDAIAIIGLACRFPGAGDPETFWRNLCQGRESITRFSDEELLAAGVDPALLANPLFVPAAATIEGADRFDAAFFGYSPREAAVMDPQHRLFLEVAWEAFEAAGHHPLDVAGEVGVFAGAGGVVTSYLLANAQHPELAGDTASLAYVGNDKDFIATRVSYKLNFTGPSLAVQTACSTSLVAVHLGCQSLLSGESDLVLAGASTVRVPLVRGYLAERGSVHSRNGQCRSFDADGRGVVFGSGVGAVLLRRLDDALADGDPVRAVIRGTAIGNDGADKASFPAPSATGQARAMTRALARSGVPPESVGYVECHAAGTWLGDPIEFDALAAAFGSQARPRGSCALGSVKPNIGHPEQAAGMAGLIKAVLATERGLLPPNLHFDRPNPHIDFDASPFYVNTELREWPRAGHPRRACVNSLGIGGTNAFAVIEEAPPRAAPARDEARGCHVLTLSAKSAAALDASAGRLRALLAGHPGIDPGELCFTSNVSRSQFPHRLALAVNDLSELTQGLAAHRPVAPPEQAPAVAFLFSGQGTQHPGMGAGLYAAHPGFRAALDRCQRAFGPLLPRPLLEVMFAAGGAQSEAHRMDYAQPALFALEYGLAALWQEWGIAPRAVMGHSLGELVAACVAGAVDFEEAAALVAARGRLMHELPGQGAMAAVFAPEEAVAPLLPEDGSVVVAAVNSPCNTVVSGDRAALAAAVERLGEAGLEWQPLALPDGYHSRCMEPMLDALEAAAGEARWRRPEIAMVSNLDGTRVEAPFDARYWREHARRAVRFADGVRSLDASGCDTYLEIGSGTTLVGLVAQVLPEGNHRLLPSLARDRTEWASLMAAAAALYEAGAPIDWRAVHRGVKQRRIVLPTYPFEGKRFWVEARGAALALSAPTGRTEAGPATAQAGACAETRPAAADAVTRIVAARRDAPALAVDARVPEPASAARVGGWLYRSCWRASPRGAVGAPASPGAWLVFADVGGVGRELASALGQRGATAHLVTRAEVLERTAPRRWTLDPGNAGHFRELLERVCAEHGAALRGVVWLWGLDAPALDEVAAPAIGAATREVARGALALLRAAGEGAARGGFAARIHLVTRNAFQVDPRDPPAEALQGLLWGLGRSFALESPALWGGLVDLGARDSDRAGEAGALLEDLCAPDGEDQIAWRGGCRFVQRIARAERPGVDVAAPPFHGDASYLITGGLGLIGLATARHLVERAGVRSLVLAGRRGADAAGAAAVDALRAQGARVQVVAADLGVVEDVERLLAPTQGMPPLRGVIHCAGVLDNALVERMDWAQFERVAAAKIAGAWLLDRFTRDLPLDLFVLNSSLLSLIGSPGQGNYTAANAFLDALGARRRAEGRPATVINWTAWAGGGLAAGAGAVNEAAWRELGLDYIGAADAMSAFEGIMASRAGQTAVAIADWPAYVRQFPRPPAVLRELLPPREPAGVRAPAVSGSVAAPRSRAELAAILREHISQEMGFDEPVDPSRPLRDLGLHSLIAAALANRLARALGVPVSLVTLVRGPSVEELAQLLWTELYGGAAAAPGSAPPRAEVDTPCSPALRPPHAAAAAPCSPAPPPRAVAVAPAVASSVARSAGSRIGGGGWLVFPRPNPDARVRLFCFPYAGGNASTYRPWAERLDPDVELIAIEPPGRAERIEEPVIASLDAFFDALLPAMAPWLDRPAAFFGHCLGALTLFEAARRLRRQGAASLVHLFVSGARPPQSLLRVGRFEEALLERLLVLDRFDPFVPPHEQSDEIFSELIRHFDIGLSEDFLANAELRHLLMPAIRAEFTMASRYRYREEPAFEVPVTCFAGLDDPYATREDALGWSEHTASDYRLHLRQGDHFLVVDDREYIVDTINRELRI